MKKRFFGRNSAQFTAFECSGEVGRQSEVNHQIALGALGF